MEEQMNYTFMSSLEQFALIKTAIILWNPDDICHLTTTFNFKKKEFIVAENRVIEKVKALPLPESLKKKVLGFIRHIGIEIRNWMYDYFRISSNDEIKIQNSIKIRFRRLVRKSFKKLCWTPQGTVDEKKTGERLIRDKDLEVDITTLYKLACHNCLENDILMLWNKMPEDFKKSFYSEEGPRRVNQDKLVVLWTYDIKGEVTRMYDLSEEKWTGCTPYQYAFCCAVSSGNKPATEHFFQKLTSEERQECLNRCRPKYNKFKFQYDKFKNGGLSYLLSHMNVVQLEEMFKTCPYVMLKCLLDWPLQGLFMEKAKHMWAFIDKDVYFSVLSDIIGKVRGGFKDYNYLELFTGFWQQSPITHKEYIIHDTFYIQRLFLSLIHIKDIENVKLILKAATITDREKFIFSSLGKDLCKKLMYADEMNLLEFFFQECISSKDLMIKFRKEFKKYIRQCLSKEALEEEKDKWNKVFQLLNDLAQKFDKMTCVEEGNGPVKRLFL